MAGRRIRGLADFIPQQLLIILAPLWINGFVYMVVGRMVYMLLTRRRVLNIHARRLTFLFVIFDIIAFLVQASSGSLMSSDNPKTANIGIKILMAGIGLQQFFITMFIVLTGRFQYKLNVAATQGGDYVEQEHVRRDPESHADDYVSQAIHTVPWRRLLYSLYAVLIFITIRNVFRLVEFSDGINGPTATHEAYFYCLEALPILAAVTILAVIHPSCVLRGPDSEFPPKEKKSKKSKQKKRRSSHKPLTEFSDA
ncbi:hypothetical protein EYZ11_007370 [Aspergillus tanneri]|nr:hypothetical protein EYZ11_007370 [Aspergillus tanneri]